MSREREAVEGVEGSSVASRGSRGGCHGEAGGGGLRVRACVRCPSSWQGGRRQGGGVEMGWAGQVGLVGCRGKSR